MSSNYFLTVSAFVLCHLDVNGKSNVNMHLSTSAPQLHLSHLNDGWGLSWTALEYVIRDIFDKTTGFGWNKRPKSLTQNNFRDKYEADFEVKRVTETRIRVLGFYFIYLF